MASAQRTVRVTSMHYDDMDDDDVFDVDQVWSPTGIVDHDRLRVTVHPQPLLARNTSGRRNYFMPRCETEWIQMVNYVNNNPAGNYYIPESAQHLHQTAPQARSISANSYFDPYTLRSGRGSSSRPVADAHTSNQNMTRPQMERAYQRVCGQMRNSDARALSRISSRSVSDSLGRKNESPLLTARSATLASRSSSSFSTPTERCGVRTRLTDDSFSSGLTTHESECKGLPTLPRLAPVDLQLPADVVLSSREQSPRRNAWSSARSSAPYRYDRTRIVKKSPPWRSLMNRMPQGIRASGDLCPNHCRCCFENSYNPSIREVFKLDHETNDAMGVGPCVTGIPTHQGN